MNTRRVDISVFLAVSIVLILAIVVVSLLWFPPEKLSERTATLLSMVIAAVLMNVKEVFGFIFGSSKGSQAKDDTIMAKAMGAPLPLPTDIVPPPAQPESDPAKPIPAPGG